MSKKEFDDLKGKLEPDYPRPKIPKELDEVDYNGKPKVKLNFSDFFNILLAILKNEALDQLNPAKVTKVKGWITVASVVGATIIILAFISCFV